MSDDFEGGANRAIELKIFLTIRDENDNRPVFQHQSPYLIRISEVSDTLYTYFVVFVSMFHSQTTLHEIGQKLIPHSSKTRHLRQDTSSWSSFPLKTRESNSSFISIFWLGFKTFSGLFQSATKVDKC